MSNVVHIELLPLGQKLTVPPGTALQDILFSHGVEFPCGGQGRCKGCKVRLLGGWLPTTEEDRQKLSPAELADGWRLACRARANNDLKLDLAQWEATILSDESVFAFTPQPGLGVAIDLGTTTLVAQLLDLQTGHVLAVRTALNAQARHGGDIMSRVEFAVAGSGQRELQDLIRRQLGGIIQELLASATKRHRHSSPPPEDSPKQTDAAYADGIPATNDLTHIILVGNTVMHHLFCGLDLEPLSHFPFEPTTPGLQSFSAADLGWDLAGNPAIRFLPCLGGFVGSDILAGVLATKLHESEPLVALLDLGTNGEIVVGNHRRLLCASTAAGPAFEGARISMGMRAATGAISAVQLRAGQFRCHVLGDGAPRGICGSGLVDAVAAGLELGRIRTSGRLAQGESLEVAPPVALNQRDIRELQLAKGAIAAGLRLLLAQWGASPADLTRVYLAGAFGNYINQASARRIGLIDYPPEKVEPAGNTALLGAKLALFGLREHNGQFPDILARTTHVSLNEDPQFQEAFVQEMGFPAG